MNDEDLKTTLTYVWLVDNYGIEQAELWNDALFYMSLLKDASVYDVPEATIMRAEQTDTLTVWDELRSNLQVQCHDVLLQYGVVLKEDELVYENQHILNQIMEALTYLDRWEDKQTLFDIIDNADTTEDAFAECVEEVVGLDVHSVLEVIFNIDENLMGKIKQINTVIEELPIAKELTQSVIDQLKKLEVEEGGLPNFIRRGGSVGLTSEHYVRLFRTYLQKIDKIDKAILVWTLLYLVSKEQDFLTFKKQLPRFLDLVYRGSRFQMDLFQPLFKSLEELTDAEQRLF